MGRQPPYDVPPIRPGIPTEVPIDPLRELRDAERDALHTRLAEVEAAGNVIARNFLLTLEAVIAHVEKLGVSDDFGPLQELKEKGEASIQRWLALSADPNNKRKK